MGETPPQPVRVPIHLEEVPLFYLGGRGHRSRIPEIVFAHEGNDGSRTMIVRGDSRYGIGNGFTQKVWLALLVVFDRQGRPRDGRVRFSHAELLTIMKLDPDSGRNHSRIRIAIHQLDGTRVYVTGRPLAGPAPDETHGAGDRAEHKYSLLSGDGVLAAPDEEAVYSAPGALRLVADGGEILMTPDEQLRDAEEAIRNARRRSVRHLGGYVTQSLIGKVGREVPEMVFGLSSGYAVRMVRLLGKRANGEKQLSIRVSRLAPALPCLAADGRPMLEKLAVRAIKRASDELLTAGFLGGWSFDDERRMFHFELTVPDKRHEVSPDSSDIPPGLAPEAREAWERMLRERRAGGANPSA